MTAAMDSQAGAVGRGHAALPDRLINIDHGDRARPDLRGLFQQREPWGTLGQRVDPV